MQQTTCDTGNLMFVVTLQLCDCCVVYTTTSQIVLVTLREMTVHCLLFLSGIKPLYKKFSVNYWHIDLPSATSGLRYFSTWALVRTLKLENVIFARGEIL